MKTYQLAMQCKGLVIKKRDRQKYTNSDTVILCTVYSKAVYIYFI